MNTISDKLDLSKADKNYYTAPRHPQLVDLDAYYYLSHEGQCSPSDEQFNRAIERLYAVAYTIKFLCKASDMDFVVPKMEGQWWIDGGHSAQHLLPETPMEQWHWKILIRLPECVEPDHFYRAVSLVKKKKQGLLEDEVKLELAKACRAVQMLHLGSYHAEQPTIEAIVMFCAVEGLTINRYHKEIYLNDPRKTPEEKLRTIIRYGVE